MQKEFRKHCMSFTPKLPINEIERLTLLRSLCLLDTPADPAFDLITELAAKTFNVPIAVVSLIDSGRQWFKSKVGLAASQTPRDQAFCAYAINGSETMIVLDAIEDNRFRNNPLVTDAPYIRFYAGAPLVLDGGKCLGTLCIIDTTARTQFTREDLQVLEHLRDMVVDRIETLRTIGFIDPLTLLPNRTRFVEDVGLWLDSTDLDSNKIAVSVDVCGAIYFSEMNKALGWEYAENFLISAKEQLLRTLPLQSFYRVGTTLFAFILDEKKDGDLTGTIKKLIDGFSEAIEHQGIPHTVDISIGVISLNESTQAPDVVRSLMAAADMAREQDVGSKVYERSHDQAQQHTFNILTALPNALNASDQLSLHYQPKVDMHTGKCVGAEALLRWSHPLMGNVPPTEFIGLAEKTALMRRITQWVLRTAFAQAAKWQMAGHTFTVAVNVSAIDLDHEDFVDLLCRKLEMFSVDPRLIEIEFTESAISINPERMQSHLARIRLLGMQLSIDDFGTGYSNLNYLKRIPATTLKIDQSFISTLITDGKNSTIVPAMIRLGHDLGHTIVAEGIESEEIYNLLSLWGCDEGQGYWIAKPMPIALFEDWLINRT